MLKYIDTNKSNDLDILLYQSKGSNIERNPPRELH